MERGGGGGLAAATGELRTKSENRPTDRPTEELSNGYAHELPPTPLPPPPPPPAQQTIPGWKGGLLPKQIHRQVRKRYLGQGGRGGGKGGSFLPGIWGRRSDGRGGRMERGGEKKIPGAGEQLMWAVLLMPIAYPPSHDPISTSCAVGGG